MREAGDQAHSNRVHRQDENDWNRRCRLFDCDGRVSTSDNYIDFKAHELLRNLFEAFAAALCPVIFDRNVATFIPAEFAQPLHESGGPWFPGRWRGCTQKPDDRESARLPCPCRERPRRRAAEQRDEIAALHHSITSSASASSFAGTSRPSTLAATTLMTSSYLVGISTGKSPGFAPLRMRA